MLETCTVIGYDKNGFGICKIKNKRISIQNAIKGEEVRITRLRNNLYLAIDVLKNSPHRVKPPCQHFNSCGGCRWQHINYDHQLEIKQSIIEKLFGSTEKITASPLKFGYRNKMEFSFAPGEMDTLLGLHEIGSFDTIIDLDKCLLQPNSANEVMSIIREFISKKRYVGYNSLKREGFLRYLVIRSSFKTRQIMINLITTSKGTIDLDSISNTVNVDSAIWSISDNPSDTAIGKIVKIIGGKYIEEKLLDFRFKIGPYSFFQVNTLQAENMLDYIIKNVDEGVLGLDLYSGVGTFSIALSSKFNKIIGIEVVEEAVQLAWENASLNDVNNVEFKQGLVESLIKHFESSKIDTVIVDPPRAGLHKKVIRGIVRINPKQIIYVSCNPFTAKRDVDYLKKAGYSVGDLKPFDQFPHTPHIEMIITLSK